MQTEERHAEANRKTFVNFVAMSQNMNQFYVKR
jgi:hypothetical protein